MASTSRASGELVGLSGAGRPRFRLGTHRRHYVRRYALFALPAALVVVAVIIFPWFFTIFMSVHSWDETGGVSYAGLANFLHLVTDPNFGMAILRTLYFTVIAVGAPLVLGIYAALCFHERFPMRGLARTIFILPMMATPVAIALVFAMMFNPQMGVLNYLLTSIGLPPFAWVYSESTVIPTLAMVETWEWTPLVMLIVLGGLASLSAEPYEAARLDGANAWQSFRFVTWPQLLPFIIVAAVIRTIDALKSFDVIYVISQGGPGSASTTMNIYLYQQAFSYYHIGYGAAVVIVFFAIIVAITLVLLMLRARAA